MIKVTDKFVGLVNKPGYTHCSTQEDFTDIVIHCSIPFDTYTDMMINHLKENNIIAEGETPVMYYGKSGVVSKNETWDEAEQTLTRELNYVSIEDYNKVKELHRKIDWANLFPEDMFEYTVLSIDEV